MIGRHTNRGSLRLRSVVTPEQPEQKRSISPSMVVAVVAHVALVTGLAAWKIPALVSAPRTEPISATVTLAGLREPEIPVAGGSSGHSEAGGRGTATPALTVAPARRPKLEMPPVPQPRLPRVIAVETPGPAPFASFEPSSPPASMFGEGDSAGNGTGNGVGNGITDGVAGNGEGNGTGAGTGNGEGAGFGGANYVRSPQPRYPAVARQQGWEGTTVLRVEIQADGKIGAIQIVQSAGHKALDDSAIEAVRAAQFQPARHNGTPITSWVEVPVTFRLNRG
jgi:protein TonB